MLGSTNQELNDQLVSTSGDSTIVRRRYGLVNAINTSDDTVDVNVGGVIIPHLRRSAYYTPALGESVIVDVTDAESIVVGPLAPSSANTYSGGGGAGTGSGIAYGGRMYLSADVVLPDASDVTVPFDLEDYADAQAITFDNTGIATVMQPGTYTMTANAQADKATTAPPNPIVIETVANGSNTPSVTTYTSDQVRVGDLLVLFQTNDFGAVTDILAPTNNMGAWTDGGIATTPLSPDQSGHIKLWYRTVTRAGVQTIKVNNAYNIATAAICVVVRYHNGIDKIALGYDSTNDAQQTGPNVAASDSGELYLLGFTTRPVSNFIEPNGMQKLLEFDVEQWNTGVVFAKTLTASGSVGSESVATEAVNVSASIALTIKKTGTPLDFDGNATLAIVSGTDNSIRYAQSNSQTSGGYAPRLSCAGSDRFSTGDKIAVVLRQETGSDKVMKSTYQGTNFTITRIGGVP
jgi:hypothetical protein